MSRFRFKLDENLGQRPLEILRRAGYEGDRITEQGLGGAPDEEVWRHVVELDRFFVTLDLDFSDVRRYPPGSHPGILLLRPRSRSTFAVSEVLRRVLEDGSLEDLRGTLAVADPRHTRIRRAEG